MAPGSSPLRRPFFSNLDFNVAGCFFLFPFFLSLYSLPPFLFSFFLLSERDTLCRRYVKDTRIQSDAIFFLSPPPLLRSSLLWIGLTSSLNESSWFDRRSQWSGSTVQIGRSDFFSFFYFQRLFFLAINYRCNCWLLIIHDWIIFWRTFLEFKFIWKKKRREREDNSLVTFSNFDNIPLFNHFMVNFRY